MTLRSAAFRYVGTSDDTRRRCVIGIKQMSIIPRYMNSLMVIFLCRTKGMFNIMGTKGFWGRVSKPLQSCRDSLVRGKRDTKEVGYNL